MYTPISSHTHGSWSTDDRTPMPSSPFCFDCNDSLPCRTLLPYIIPISLGKDSLPYLHSDGWGMGFGVAQWSSRLNQDFLGHWPWGIWGTCSDTCWTWLYLIASWDFSQATAHNLPVHLCDGLEYTSHCREIPALTHNNYQVRSDPIGSEVEIT